MDVLWSHDPPNPLKMAYDEYLGDRLRDNLTRKGVVFEAKKMMGGLCFMVDGKMCIGVVRESLMARIAPEVYDGALARKGCKPMDFTRRPMKGFVFVEPDGFDLDADFEYWVDLCLDFNPRAKASKKK